MINNAILKSISIDPQRNEEEWEIYILFYNDEIKHYQVEHHTTEEEFLTLKFNSWNETVDFLTKRFKKTGFLDGADFNVAGAIQENNEIVLIKEKYGINKTEEETILDSYIIYIESQGDKERLIYHYTPVVSSQKAGSGEVELDGPITEEFPSLIAKTREIYNLCKNIKG